jgi:hypothetical protein
MSRKTVIISLLCAAALEACFSSPAGDVKTPDTDILVTVKTGTGRKPISPYIYGINEFVMDKDVTAFAVRQGGNRYSAYNWENNFSNAGSDWYHYSDTYLSASKSPADCAITLAAAAANKNIPYKITTLQMAGYVSADNRGPVGERETAPSPRFKRVVFAKNAPFAETPNLNDDYVYMDEYVHYLTRQLGPGGINGYNLDNEPALWPHTHPRVHPGPVTYADIMEKSAALAAAVKAVDPNAEIFGPALYGVGAYNDFQSAPDWKNIKDTNRYDWFISAYLDEMAKNEQKYGIRLLDVLDVHYYSEARGQCRVTECRDESHTSCVQARVQAVRSLWEDGYIEDSWIGQWLKQCLPVIKRLNQSIDKYYPNTKLSFTEYDLGGGGQISGAVAQADILGLFGKTGVYLATLWPDASNCDYQMSAINLYTNYDGKGGSFGNTHVAAECSDIENAYAYAAIKDADESVVTVVIANKSLSDDHTVTITIDSSLSYTNAVPYMITTGSHNIIQTNPVAVTGNSFIYKLPPMTVVQFVISAT